MEQQVLSNPKLKPYYDKVTWLFVSRNFKQDPGDREAARTHDRFGVSSWPQLVVFDPRDDKVLGEMPRRFAPFQAKLETLLGKVQKPIGRDLEVAKEIEHARVRRAAGENAEAEQILARVAKGQDAVGASLEARELLRTWNGDPRSMLERLSDPDVRERAIAIESIGADGVDQGLVEPVAAALLDEAEHLVVRVRALGWLRLVAPERIAAGAASLLKAPNDPLRYGVLEVLVKHPDPKLGPVLAAMFRGAGTTTPSRNPNVLRGHLAAAIRESGDASAVEAMAGLAREAAPNNGTTRQVLDVLAAIAQRLPDTRPAVVAVLLDSFPGREDAGEEWLRRRIPGHAKAVHAALEKANGRDDLPAPPAEFTKEARAAYLRRLRAALR